MPTGPSMELLLVRHGESEGNRAGRMQGHREYPLSNRGRAQAQSLGQMFVERKLEWTAAYTSPLSRARQTADILTGMAQRPAAEVDPDLIEITAGSLEGLNRSEILERHPDFMQRGLEGLGDFSEYGGESYDDMQRRVEQLCGRIFEKHSAEGQRVLLVSHGGLLFQLAKRLICVPVPRVAILRFGNCTSSLIRMRKRRGMWLGELVWHLPIDFFTHEEERDVGALFR